MRPAALCAALAVAFVATSRAALASDDPAALREPAPRVEARPSARGAAPRWNVLIEPVGAIRWLDRVPTYGGALAIAAGIRRPWGGVFGGVEGALGSSRHGLPMWSTDAFVRVETASFDRARVGVVVGTGALGFGRVTKGPPLWAASLNAALFVSVDLVATPGGSVFLAGSARGDLVLWSAAFGPSLGLGATF